MSDVPNPEVDVDVLEQLQQRTGPRRQLRLSLAGPERSYLLALLVRQATFEREKGGSDKGGYEMAMARAPF